MTQRVAVVIDNVGTFTQRPEDERDEILEDLRRRGLDLELVWYGNSPHDLPETQIDLLVVDYGALWQITDLMDDWTRRMVDWAENHPSTFVALWSSMTGDAWVDELKDRFEAQGGEVGVDGEWDPPWPANVRSFHAGNKYYAKWGDGDSIDWLGESYERLFKWFGVEEKNPYSGSPVRRKEKSSGE